MSIRCKQPFRSTRCTATISSAGFRQWDSFDLPLREHPRPVKVDVRAWVSIPARRLALPPCRAPPL